MGGHVGDVALLSLAVLFGAVSSGQMALVQGMRRIADLARANVWGGFYGTLLSILIDLLLWEGWRGPSTRVRGGHGNRDVVVV